VLGTGTGGLTKTGTGTLTLAGNNTFTGDITVTGGVLAISTQENLGGFAATALNLDGGTLRVAGADIDFDDSLRTLNLGTGGGILDTVNNLIWDNPIVGSGSLTKTGAGTLTLEDPNTFTGAFNINAGTVLFAGGNDRLADVVAVTIGSGATLDVNTRTDTIGALAGAGTLTNTGGAAATLTFGGIGTDTLFSGTITDAVGALNLTKQGAGRTVLSGNNSYDGTTLVNAGVLTLQHANALGTTTGGTTVASGAALEIQGGIAVGAEALTLSGTGLGGGGALRNVSGANSLAGTLTLAANTEIQSDAGTLTLAGGINGNAASRTLTFDGDGQITANGVIGANVSTLTKTGTGTLTLAAANTYTGATTIGAGTVVVAHASGLGTTGAGTTVADGATLAFTSGGPMGVAENLTIQGQGVAGTGSVRNLAGSTTLSGAIALANEASFGVATGTQLTASGTVSGTGFGLTKLGGGTLVLSGNNTYTGTTAVTTGTLVAQSANALGGGANPTTVADGATLALSGNFATAEAVTLTGAGVGGTGALQGLTGASTITGGLSLTGNTTLGASSGATLTATGDISGSGFNLVKTGAGTLALSGANTYTGTTTVRDGTLTALADAPATGNGVFGDSSSVIQLGDASTSGSASLALLAGGPTGGVDIDRAIAVNNFGTTTTIGGTNPSGLNTFNGGIALSKGVNLTSASGGTVGFTGTLSGTGTVTANGTGTVVLSGNNTYSGATTVASGTLVAGSSTALGSTAAGTTVSSGATLALQGGISLGSGETLTVGGAGVGGTGALRNLSGDNTVTGAVTLTGATTLGADAGTLAVTGAIGGAQNLTTTGAGQLVFTGNNSLSGSVTVGGTGSLTLANGGGQSLGSISGITVNSGATLALGAAHQINDSVALTLAGGTLNVGSYSETMRQLSVTAASSLNYLDDGSILRFNGVNGVSSGLVPVATSLTIDNWAGSLTGSGSEQLVVYSHTGTAPIVTNITFSDWGTATTIARGDLGAGFYEIVPLLTGSYWDVNGNGNWNANNWANNTSAGGTNIGSGANRVAILGDTVTSVSPTVFAPLTTDPVINMNSNRVIGKLIFENSANRNYTISGTRRLDFDVSSGQGQIIVNDNGAHTVNVDSRFLDDLLFTNNSNAATGLTLAGDINLRNNNNLTTFNGSGRTVVSGVISRNAGAGNILKTGTGTLVLSGANTYTGTTTLRHGTLELAGNAPSGAAGNLGNATSAVIVNDASTTAGMNTALLMTDADGGSTVGRAITVGSQGATTTLGGTNTSGTNTFSGAISLDKDVQLTATVGGTVAFSGVLSGVGGLEKVGGGLVSLSGGSANTNTGNITVSAGTLSVDKTNAGGNGGLGDTAAVTVAAGATLRFNGSANQTGEAIGSLAGAGTVNNLQGTALTLTTGGNNASTTFSGLITDTGGNLALVKAGTGTFTLTGANTYDGDTTVNAGTLIAAHSTALGNTTGNTAVAAGATLGLTGNITVAAGEDLSLTGSASPSTAALSNLAGNNTWAGLVTLTGGAGDDVMVSAAAGTQLSVTGAIGETGGAKDLFKTGAGTLVLSGNNTYTGTTNVTNGTLVAASNTALGTSATGTTVQIGATLGFQNNVTIAAGESLTLNTTATPAAPSLKNISGTNTAGGAVTLSGGVNTGATLDANAGTLTLSGAITSAVPTNNNFLTKTGSGTLVLSGTGANTFAGPFTVNHGTVALNKTPGVTATGTGQLTIGDGIDGAGTAVVRLDASNQINDTSDILIRPDGRLDLQGNSDTVRAVTLEGGQVTTAGAGTLTLGGNLTFTGVGSTTAAINGNLNLGGDRIVQVGNNAVNGDSDLTLNGVVSGPGARLIKNDLGTLELTGAGANTFTGGLNVNDGTVLLNKAAGTAAIAGGSVNVGDGIGSANSAVLRLNASNQISDLSALTVASDGRVDLTNLNETVGSIAGQGSILIGTGQLIAGGNNTSTSFGGTLTGTGLLAKEGSGTLTITSNLVYAGDIALNAGTLQFNADNAFTGNLTLLAGTTLRLSDADLAVNNLTFAGTGNVTIDFAGASSLLNVLGTLSIAPGITITVRNWQDAADYWYAQNWLDAVFDLRGQTPMNRITFDTDGADPTTWTGNHTQWQSYDNQITPVPEPSTYGALLLLSAGGLLAWRRRRAARP